MISDKLKGSLERRKLLKSLGGLAAVGSVGSLIGCGTDNTGPSSSVSSSSSSSSSISSSSSSVVSSSSSSVQQPVDGWASGGTASMWADFPPANAFANSTPANCTTDTGSQILGPCFFALEDYREDISDGELGVPTVFAFKVLDGNCNPRAGVVVDLWHTNCEGFYSADTSGSPEVDSGWNQPLCSNNNQRAAASKWHRGALVTDNNGDVFFKSCFPGWYAGRTNHLHVRLVENGQEILVSQFAWEDALCDEIHVNHPEYIGQRQDTSLGGDFAFSGGGGFGGGGNTDQWVMDAYRQDDGSMVTSKVLIVS